MWVSREKRGGVGGRTDHIPRRFQQHLDLTTLQTEMTFPFPSSLFDYQFWAQVNKEREEIPCNKPPQKSSFHALGQEANNNIILGGWGLMQKINLNGKIQSQKSKALERSRCFRGLLSRTFHLNLNKGDMYGEGCHRFEHRSLLSGYRNKNFSHSSSM